MLRNFRGIAVRRWCLVLAAPLAVLAAVTASASAATLAPSAISASDLPTAVANPFMPVAAHGTTVEYGAVEKSARAAPTAGAARASVRGRHLLARIASAGCWDYSIWVKEYNVFGSTVAKYEDPDVAWCGNGSKITSRQPVNPEGFTYYLGWSYKGQQSYSNVGGVGSTYWIHNTQGSFCYIDTGVIGCVQNWYPSLRSTAYGNGGFSYSG
jgi:hypothetical protein